MAEFRKLLVCVQMPFSLSFTMEIMSITKPYDYIYLMSINNF